MYSVCYCGLVWCIVYAIVVVFGVKCMLSWLGLVYSVCFRGGVWCIVYAIVVVFGV